MLKRLKLKNIGLIDDLSVEFGEGLNILTGETGAGKSMILSALNLFLGERADYSNLKSRERDGSAEAVFGTKYLLSPIPDFEEQGIEPEEGEFIIRRILQKEGKSRALVNGSTLTLASLKSAGERMIDIHGQHEHQALLKKDTHLPWLDHYLNIRNEAAEIATLFSKTKEKESELFNLIQKQKEAQARREFLEFKAKDIEKAEINKGEEEKLEGEHKILANAERIRETGSKVFETLYDSENSILSRLEESAKEMEQLKSTDPFFEKYSTLFSDIAAQVSDCAMEIQSYCSGIENDPSRLEAIEERQSLIERLKRKYNADITGLLNVMEEAKRELSSIESADEERRKMEDALAELKKELHKKAKSLHKIRLKGMADFKKEVEKELNDLNMGAARFEVDVKLPEVPEMEGYELDGKTTRIFSHGFGDFQFLISTNEGQEPRPLTKVASGGEISRIMLGLKCATGKTQPIPVLVFDEIDIGIGGKTADLVGEKLKRLSKNCQIFCITHLPQIARQADNHFLVQKSTDGDNTVISIRKLNDDERVEELARMQAGKEITETARKHAREMIDG